MAPPAGGRGSTGASPASRSSPSPPASACRRSCRRCPPPSSRRARIWWVTCVACTAGGLALIVYGRSLALALLGAGLIVVPHLIGAPQPPAIESPIPEALHHRFVVAVTVTNLVFWLLLGLAVSLIRGRFAAGLGAPQGRLA